MDFVEIKDIVADKRFKVKNFCHSTGICTNPKSKNPLKNKQ
jgi:hypothetical protein